MKKVSRALFLGASLCAASLTVSAEEVVVPKVPTVDFDAFRAAAYCPAKVQNIKNGRIIYAVKGKDLPAAYLMVRAAEGEKVRVDAVTANDVFTACRNGDVYWGYDKENGCTELSAKDSAEMKLDTAFYPFPFLKNSEYGALIPGGTGLFRTSECLTFEVQMPGKTDSSFTVWVDKETQRLCLVSAEDEDGVYSTSFFNYQEIGGVEIASRINMSSPEGVATLTLKSAEWNVTFPEGVFDRDGSLARDPRVLELQKFLGKVDANKNAAKEAAAEVKAQSDKVEKEAAEKRIAERKAAKDEKKVEGLKKEIARLDAEIEEKSGRLSALEEYIRANLEGSMETAKEYARTPYRYRRAWSYRGWGGWVRKHNSPQRRLAKKFYKEAEASGKEYEKVAKELTALRLQRSEAQAQLDKLEASLVKAGEAAPATK